MKTFDCILDYLTILVCAGNHLRKDLNNKDIPAAQKQYIKKTLEVVKKEFNYFEEQYPNIALLIDSGEPTQEDMINVWRACGCSECTEELCKT